MTRTRMVAKGQGGPSGPFVRAAFVRFVALAGFVLASGSVVMPRAQTTPDTPEKKAGADAGTSGPEKSKLRGLETQIEKSDFEQRRLGYEIDNLSGEAQKLRLALIEVAGKVRLSEERLAAQAEKLASLTKREDALRRSLHARERVTAEILAAMQRIGRKPPPALLVAPEDVLSAMRAAILLGAVLPDMRDEAMILVADLKTLTELRRETALVTEQARSERDSLDSERTRMGSLVAERQSQIKLSKEQLESEKQRVATLSREAKSLRELIARSENEITGNTRAAEIARRAPAPPRAGTTVASLDPDAANALARLQPRQGFAERRGQIALPVSGVIERQFGQPDGLGGTERGITISSNRDAVVVAPADGWVHFAGPYRGYGHLLIINAGAGYHVVLAGMGRLSVEIGQFVLAGEPVGLLGSVSAVAREGEAGGSGDGGSSRGSQSDNSDVKPLGGARPALYVEFRKDGSPVDPSPWWSSQTAEKARG
jgi:murein hydrolase activator